MADPKLGIRLRGIYSRPWTKIAQNMTFTQSFMKKIGRILIKEIVLEAKRQRRAQGNRSTPRGEPEGLPKGPEFYKSFSFKIRGKSTIEIWCDWPVIEQLIEGRDEFKMTWLTQEAGRLYVPMGKANKKGKRIIRTAPEKIADSWIHPGFAQHDFIEKGLKSAQKKVAKLLIDEAAKKFSKGDPTR